jgi:hypothetical protein
MRSLTRWLSGFVCAWMAIAGGGTASAQISGALNVRALPLPHPSCPGALNATPNGGTLDTSAFQCAIALAPASGAEIYVPPGIYNLDATLSITNKPIAFRGEGQRISTLLWSNIGANNGITFTQNAGTYNYQLTVSGLSLLRDNGSGGTAIAASWPVPVSATSRGGTSATISDVHIGNLIFGPEGGTPIFWNTGIRLTNAMGARISQFNINGWNDRVNCLAAIHINGKSIGVSINDGNMGRSKYGVYISGSSENTRVEDIETSENAAGYYYDTTGKYHHITNVHGGVLDQGILIINGSDFTITDTFFLGVGSPLTAIEAYNPSVVGEGFEVRGNLVFGFQYGITLNGPFTNARVTGNMVAVPGIAISLVNGVTWSGVVANDPSGGAIVVHNGCACNFVVNNP